jgi:hypothetical protein
MVSWLKQNLAVAQTSIVEAGIFGSVSKGVNTPNDCDLYVVSHKSPDSTQWQQLKCRLNKIREGFNSKFKLTLNVVLMTLGEWEEKKEFFLCNSSKILIKNCPTSHFSGLEEARRR